MSGVAYEERRAQVIALKAEGLTHRQIAERLGLSRSHVGHIASSRSYETGLRLSLEAKQRRTGTCEECGATTRYDGRNVARRCGPCGNAASARTRRGHGPCVDALMAFLDQPRRYRAIRDHLGITSGHTSNLLHRNLKDGRIVRVGYGLYRKASA